MPLPVDEKDLHKRPEAQNLLGIYSSLNNQGIEKTIKEFSGQNFSDFKKKLTELMVEKISPISIEMNKIKSDKTFIDKVLKDGNLKAIEISSKKINAIKKIIGF